MSERDDGTYRFPKLSGPDNYKEWARNMQFALMDAGLWNIVSGDIVKPVEDSPQDPPQVQTAAERREFKKELDEWVKDDARGKGKIGRMSMSMMQMQIDLDWTSAQTWKHFKEKCSPSGWSNKWAVMNRLEETSYASCKDIPELQVKINKIQEEIKDLEITLEDYITIKVLNGLGEKFETWVTLLSQKARDDSKLPSLTSIFQNLMEEEHRIKGIPTNRLHQTNQPNRGGQDYRSRGSARGGRGGRGGNNSRSSSSSNMIDCKWCAQNHKYGRDNCPFKDKECYTCHKTGHMSSTCPDNKDKKNDTKKTEDGKDDGRKSSKPQNSGQKSNQNISHSSGTFVGQFSMSKCIETSPLRLGAMKHKLMAPFIGSLWLLDSGASCHCSGDKTLFKNMKPMNDSAETASGEVIPIIGKGDVDVQIDAGTLTLTNVRYSPHVTTNLISVCQLNSFGISVNFSSDNNAKLIYNGSVIAYADKIQNQYLLRNEALRLCIQESENSTYFALTKKSMDISIWHRRFIHTNYQHIIENSRNVLDLSYHGKIPEELCEACMLGKHEASVSRNPMKKADRFLDRIHVDIGEGLPQTFRGNRYFLLIKDDASGMLFIRLMKTKGQIFELVRDFRQWIETQKPGLSIKRIRSGAELLSEKFTQWFKETGIQWEQSSPNIPAQNGVVERAMYTVVGPLRSILKSYFIPLGLWDLFVEGIVYTLNRITTKSNSQNVTPFEVANGVPPNVGHLRALGCRAYVHVPKLPSRQKLDDRSWKGVFVGYNSENQWKIYNPRTKKVNIARDVKFDELHSYYSVDLSPPDTYHKDDEEDDIDEFWTNADDDYLEKMHNNAKITKDKDLPSNSSTYYPPTPRSNTPSHTNVTDNDAVTEGDGNQGGNDDDSVTGIEPVTEGLGRSDSTNSQSEPKPKRTRGKAPLPPPSDRTLRERTNKPDYNKMNDPGRKAPSYAHMHRVMKALESEDDYGLPHDSEPQTLKQAKDSPQWPEWKAAMESEMQSLIENETWELTKLPSDRKVITGRWVFKIKHGVDGKILRYKARWVVHGYKQLEGIDFSSTWAGVVKPASFRMLFAISAERGLGIEQLDIVTAFLYGFLDEAIYIKQPEGFIEDPSLVCLLKKALYGLKQSPRVWYGVIHDFLKNLGFSTSNQDHSVFISSDKQTFICVYVDDLLIFGKDKKFIATIKEALHKRFKMTDLGSVSHYLGLSVKSELGRVILNQSTYINKILKRFDMLDCAPVSTPMESGTPGALLPSDSDFHADETVILWYGSAVGSLNYVAVMTRPDISYALSVVSRYSSNPSAPHVKAVIRIFRYLKGTIDEGIVYYLGGGEYLGYCDSDYAGLSDGRRSTTGWVFYMYGGPISWSSKRQEVVTLSSTEAEYYALGEAGKEAIWLGRLLMELGETHSESSIIYSDNRGAMALAENPEFHRRTKHIDVRYHWIREKVEEGVIKVKWVPSAEMHADGLTKALGTVAFRRFLTMIGVQNTSG